MRTPLTMTKIMYRGLVGSRGYNLHTAESDFDWRGFYVAPAVELLSLDGDKPSSIVFNDGQSDFQIWEVKQFLQLCLKANPNALESLFAQYIAAPTGEYNVDARRIVNDLLLMRDAFLSTRMIASFGGYSKSQYISAGKNFSLSEKLSNTDDKEQVYRSANKGFMHAIRLLFVLNRTLASGDFSPDMSDWKETLVSIRSGNTPVDRIHRMYEDLEVELQDLKNQNSLPVEPDYSGVNQWLLDLRQTYYDNVPDFSLVIQKG